MRKANPQANNYILIIVFYSMGNFLFLRGI